jgi:hypothetical protein
MRIVALTSSWNTVRQLHAQPCPCQDVGRDQPFPVLYGAEWEQEDTSWSELEPALQIDGVQYRTGSTVRAASIMVWRFRVCSTGL